MEHLLGTANRGSVSTGHKEIDNSMVLYNNETSAFWLKSNNTHAGRTADGHGNGSSTGTKATFSFWHKRSGRMDYQEYRDKFLKLSIPKIEFCPPGKLSDCCTVTRVGSRQCI